MSTAVLLLAYGGPDRLEDVPAYLLSIRGGRKTPQHLVDKITERYRRIGGRSPLLEITRRVATKLSDVTGLPVYVGMRHWSPWIKDTVAQMMADGVTHTVAICMAPHYSSMSIGAYKARLDEAVAALGGQLSVDFVESWHTQSDYLDGMAANVRQALGRFPAEDREQIKVIFTAHSLPQAIIERGDPYDQQLKETARLLADKLELPACRWMFSYQSARRAAASPSEATHRPARRQQQLGPQIETLVAKLAQAGERNLLIAPIGFIADHVEILYDIDIGVQEIARQHGVRVERMPMLNDSPGLIAALTTIVRQVLDPDSAHNGGYGASPRA